jgi:hypothetical protein
MRSVLPDNIMRVLDGNAYFVSSTMYVNGMAIAPEGILLQRLPSNTNTTNTFTYNGSSQQVHSANQIQNKRFFRFDYGITCEAHKPLRSGAWKLAFAGEGYNTFNAFCIDNTLPNIRQFTEGERFGDVVGKHASGWINFTQNGVSIEDTAGCIHSVTQTSLTPTDGNNSYPRDDSVILYETPNSLFVFTANNTTSMAPSVSTNLIEVDKEFRQRIANFDRASVRLIPLKVVGNVLVAYEQFNTFGTGGSSWNDGNATHNFRYRPVFFNFDTRTWYTTPTLVTADFPQWGTQANSPNTASSLGFARTIPVIRSIKDTDTHIDVFVVSLVQGTTSESHLVKDVNLHRFRYNKGSHGVTSILIPTYDNVIDVDIFQPLNTVSLTDSGTFAGLREYTPSSNVSTLTCVTSLESSYAVPDFSNTVPDFTVSASSSSSSYEPSRLFRHSKVSSTVGTEAGWRSQGIGTSGVEWVVVEFPEPTLVNREFTFSGPDTTSNAPLAISVQGSLDGTTWVPLTDPTPLPNLNTFDISVRVPDTVEMVPFKLYRFTCHGRHGGTGSTYMSLGRIRIYKPGIPGLLLKSEERTFVQNAYTLREVDVEDGIPQYEPLYRDLISVDDNRYGISSSGSAVGYPPQNAFRSTGAWVSTSIIRTITIDIKEPTVLRRYSIRNRMEGNSIDEIAALRTWILEGFDGQNWCCIHDQSTVEGAEFAVAGAVRTYEIASQTRFTRYRITPSSVYGSSNYSAISKIGLFGIIPKTVVTPELSTGLSDISFLTSIPYTLSLTATESESVTTGVPTEFNDPVTYPLNDNVSNWTLNTSSGTIGAAYFAITRILEVSEREFVHLMITPTGFTTYPGVNYVGNTLQYLFEINEEEIHPNIVDGVSMTPPVSYWAEVVSKDVSVGLLGTPRQSLYSYMDVGSYMYIIGKDKVLTASFNQDSLKYELTDYTFDVDAVAMYLDSSNAMWIMDTTYNLYRMRLGVGEMVSLTFDEGVIYEGTPVPVKLRIATFNERGEFSSRKIHVSLGGPAEFANGTTGMVVTTPQSDYMEIPVNVIGYGNITASARPSN